MEKRNPSEGGGEKKKKGVSPVGVCESVLVREEGRKTSLGSFFFLYHRKKGEKP